MSTPTRHILLVDDDVAFTGLFKEFLLAHRPGAWRVHTAENYMTALSCLKEQSVDLVVLDVQMPIMDGVQFLSLLRKSHPNLPVIVFTGHATAENKQACLQNGAALVLNKTEIGRAFDKIYAALESVATTTATEGFRGELRQVGLPDVLQMECLGRKSSILEISGRDAAGKIFIQDGAIIHAENGARQGEPALFNLLGLRGGEFRLKPFTKPPKQTIDGHWESLLMEAARLQDEAAGAAAAAAPPAGTAGATTEPAAPAPEAVERKVEEIVLCSATGEVLYEYQAAAVERRVRLLEILSVKSAAVGKTLFLGAADRLENESSESRVVALLWPERKLFVRVAAKWS